MKTTIKEIQNFYLDLLLCDGGDDELCEFEEKELILFFYDISKEEKERFENSENKIEIYLEKKDKFLKQKNTNNVKE